ncbi:MAG TPA: glutaredoxin family protein [Candidatus Limnocylindrales bacterium]
MPAAPLPDLVLYGKPGCHLCEDAAATLVGLLDERIAAGLAVPRLVERDITTDPAWERAFFETIPVVELGQRRLPLAVRRGALARWLAEALEAESGGADGDPAAAAMPTPGASG